MTITERYNDQYPRLYVITLALKWLLGLVCFMTMASISSNDYSDSGALPSSSTSGSSDHPPNPKRQHRDWKSTDHQRSSRKNGGNNTLLYTPPYYIWSVHLFSLSNSF